MLDVTALPPADGAKLSREQKGLQEEIGAQSWASDLRVDIRPYVHLLSRVMFAPDPATCRPLIDSIWRYPHATRN